MSDNTAKKQHVQVTACIDWISVTRPTSLYPPEFPTKKQEMPRGMMGYDTGVKYIDGRIELCSSTRKEMGTHTIVSGETIIKLCELTGMDSFGIFAAMRLGGHTRLDIAIDIKHDELDIGELWTHLETKKAVTDAKQHLHVKGGHGNGQTLYVGSPKAKRRIRIYDKKAESGALHAWTRVELQYRGEFAKRAATTLAKAKNKPEQIAKMINDFIMFPKSQKWVEFIGVDTVKLGKPEKPKSNRVDWLLTTAAKALAVEMVENVKGAEFLGQFTKMVIDLYEQENQKYTDEK